MHTRHALVRISETSRPEICDGSGDSATDVSCEWPTIMSLVSETDEPKKFVCESFVEGARNSVGAMFAKPLECKSGSIEAEEAKTEEEQINDGESGEVEGGGENEQEEAGEEEKEDEKVDEEGGDKKEEDRGDEKGTEEKEEDVEMDGNE